MEDGIAEKKGIKTKGVGVELVFDERIIDPGTFLTLCIGPRLSARFLTY
jgi:hypothetical protein